MNYAEQLEEEYPNSFHKLLVYKTLRKQRKGNVEIAKLMHTTQQTTHRWMKLLKQFESYHPTLEFTKEDEPKDLPKARTVAYPLISQQLMDPNELVKDPVVNWARRLANKPDEETRAKIKAQIDLKKTISDYNRVQATLAIWFGELEYYKGQPVDENLH